MNSCLAKVTSNDKRIASTKRHLTSFSETGAFSTTIMDTKLGFCWRCNGKLRKSHKCRSCHTAEYCSKRCLEEDSVRHGSVECRLWSPPKCGSCSRAVVSQKSRCSGCYTTWYCNTECQRKDWGRHKPYCKMLQDITVFVASSTKAILRDLPYYFGNSFAKDLLNLRGKEMSSSAHGDNEFPCELSILLAASGDFRHAIKTVESLPSEYKGTVLFVMNDIDPFVTARNVLMLFMLSTFDHAKASNIASVYLSLRLTKEDYFILQGALSALMQMTPSQLKEKTNGVIEFKDGVFNDLREVWAGWSKLPCLRKDVNCKNLDEERQQLFHSTPLAESSTRASLKSVPNQHVPSLKKWLEDGVMRPSNSVQTCLPYYNPTFTGRSSDFFILRSKTSPARWNFGYCIRPDCAAFQVWDYLDVIQYRTLDSVTEMCHEFTAYCFKVNMTLMKERRLSYKIMMKNFMNLGLDLLKDVPYGFDRIHASNLIDYHRISEVIRPLEPLLSRQNPHSVLFTDTFNWYGGMDIAVEPADDFGKLKVQCLAAKDLGRSLFGFDGMSVNVFHEYYDNTDFFTCYLRGSRLAEYGKPYLKSNLPKWSEFTECNGLRMHDIHNGRNSVLPYRLRVNARPINMLRGHIRTVEWSRMPMTKCQIA